MAQKQKRAPKNQRFPTREGKTTLNRGWLVKGFFRKTVSRVGKAYGGGVFAGFLRSKKKAFRGGEDALGNIYESPN